MQLTLVYVESSITSTVRNELPLAIVMNKYFTIPVDAVT